MFQLDQKWIHCIRVHTDFGEWKFLTFPDFFQQKDTIYPDQDKEKDIIYPDFFNHIKRLVGARRQLLRGLLWLSVPSLWCLSQNPHLIDFISIPLSHTPTDRYQLQVSKSWKLETNPLYQILLRQPPLFTNRDLMQTSIQNIQILNLIFLMSDIET